MRRHLAIAFALGLSAASLPTEVFADVIHPMPINCPRGTKEDFDHSGAHCVPPLRADCPAGYVPRVIDSTSFCAAPPPAPCPKGLHWESTGPNEGSCWLNDRCDKVGEACTGGSCEELKFCIEQRNMSRYTMPVAHGTCRSQSDCAGSPETKCEKRLTCTDPASRKNEAARIEAAKKVPASAVPEPYTASSFQGAPPRYRVLKDGQNLPALPDVPEPPDDTPVTTPTPDETPDSGASTPPPEPTPNDAGAIEPPAITPTPPSSGGCAGCEVGTSDRDMAGFAALMSLLGVGIALRRKGRRG